MAAREALFQAAVERPTRSMYRRPRSSANGRWQGPGSTSVCRYRKSPSPV